jgi:hypothetical protein
MPIFNLDTAGFWAHDFPGILAWLNRHVLLKIGTELACGTGAVARPAERPGHHLNLSG